MNATYDYAAADAAGKIIRDVIGASSKADAIDTLRGQGLQPITVKERGTTFDIGAMFTRRPQQRLVMFRSLHQLYEAGVTADEAFSVIIKQARLALTEAQRTPFRPTKQKAKFLRSLVSLRYDIAENGIPLHRAMAKRPNEFTPVESAMVEAGRATGDEAMMFEQISRFLDLDRKTSKQLKDAMMMPAIVMLAAIGIMAYILVKVVPQFAEFYKGFDVPLPGIMVTMLGIDNFLSQPAVVVGITLAVLGGGAALLRWLGTADGALKFDRFRMRIPVVGQFFSKIIMVRVCRVLAMLFRAGKTHTEVLATAAPVVGSPLYAVKLNVVRRMLDDGLVANLHEAFERSSEFDAMMIGMMGLGVTTGDYATPLEKMAEWYEQDVESIAATMPGLLQGIVTILLGVVVGFVVTAVYVPLSSISSSVH